MKKLFTILFLTCLLGSVSFAQVKIGLPAGAPQASALLDLSNTGDGTRALILPKVTNTASIVTPVTGMLVYDLSSNCTKAFDNGVWSACLSVPSSPSGAAVNCPASAVNGNYNQGTALTAANTVTIVLTNNTAAAITITPATFDLVLSDVGSAGMSVASVSPASLSLAANGGTSPITYTLSGTPTASGSFTATFTKLGLTCAKTGNVCVTMVPITVTNTTTPATLPIPTAVGNTINFVAAGGTPSTGITWTMTSNPATGVFSSPVSGTGATAQAILVANASGLVTVTFTAVNACGLSISGTQGVAVSDLSVNSASSAINGYYSQTTALTAANTVTVVLINNSTVAKTITPLTTDIVLSGAGAAGITVASFSPASVPVAANGGTNTITYTLSGTPTTLGSFTATWNKVGLNLVKTSTVCLTIAPIGVSSVNSPAVFTIPIVAGNTMNFTATGGTPNTTGMSWTMTSSPATGIFSNPASGTGNTAQAILVAGASGTVTVVFSAANACGLVVTGTQTVNTYNDGLRLALNAGGCASCVAYDAAAADTWVKITAAEYAQIDNFTTVNLAGANESIMNQANQPNDNVSFSTVTVGPGTSTLPANNYIVAFSAINAKAVSAAGVYLKYSTSSSTGFSMSGPSLIVTSEGSLNTRMYNVMKRPSAVVNASSPSYIAITWSSLWIGFFPNAGTPFTNTNSYFSQGDSPTLSSNFQYVYQYQVKGTATKKW